MDSASALNGDARPLRAFGVLPPPRKPRLAGVRARIEWESGGGEFSVFGHPSPCPAPARGEGTLWRWRSNRNAAARVAVAAFLTFLFLSAALALDFPTLTGRVVDEANILNTQTRAMLTQKLADLEAKSTDQLVVVTLKSLQGTSIEDFGYQLGRHWQIGQAGKNNGVLLIVAPNEHKVRIEVGYGLEGTLTDAISRLIIENSILPRFRANDFAGGVTRGVDDIIDVLTGDAEEWKRRGANWSAAKRPESPQWFTILLGFLIPLIMLWAFYFVVGRAARGLGPSRGRQSSRSSSWYPYAPWPSGPGGFSGGGGGDSGGGFSGGGGSFGGGGASGSW